MAKWIVRRTIRFTQEVEAETREEALGAFCEQDARIETLKEVAYRGCFIDIYPTQDVDVNANRPKAETPS